jgi:hypothetical protein
MIRVLIVPDKFKALSPRKLPPKPSRAAGEPRGPTTNSTCFQ